MEKSYPVTAINKISKYTLSYEDECGNEKFISLLKCRDNWYIRYNKKESFIDKILQKREKCKYVGDRFWGYKEAFFVFYSDITVRFMVNLDKYIELGDTCEDRLYFEHIKEQIRNAGWVTFDIG